MKHKKILSIILTVLLSLTSVSPIIAIENNTGLIEKTSLFDSVYNDLIHHITYKYGDVYSFENFDYEMQGIREDENYSYIDINIITDMTLTQHPAESKYIAAMASQAMKINDNNVQSSVFSQITDYIDEIEKLYYNKSEESIFKYTVKIPKISYLNNYINVPYQLMYRVDITEDEVLNTEFVSTEKVNSNIEKIYERAENTVNMIVQSSNKSSDIVLYNNYNTVTYNRLDARDYALEHATDAPEFSKFNGQGSDCANFVSKSLNAGGFPTDDDNDWYPSSDGTTATCGINWMRTGFYDNGGVVPYMLDQEYFYEQSDESAVNAGSIMYWNTKSHVALVTYGDTVTIKYTQHSNVTLSENNAKNIIYESEDATFYMPDTSNVIVEE